MDNIDRQRIAAVARSRAAWIHLAQRVHGEPPAGTGSAPLADVADGIDAALVRQADALAGCLEGSAEQGELQVIAGVLEAYEAKRWPDGKEPGGKG